MKKIGFSLLCSVLLVVSITFGAVVAQAASSKSVTGFWRSDFVQGIAYNGTMQLSIKNYSYEIKADASVSEFYSSLANDDIIFIHTHGAPGLFTLSLGTKVTGSMVNSFGGSADTKLVYISACESGASSNVYGNIGTALCNKGVEAVVAFEKRVSAITKTDGIHRFNSLVVYKLIQGYTLSRALSTAKDQIFKETGTYWGADSYVIYGNGSMTLK